MTSNLWPYGYQIYKKRIRLLNAVAADPDFLSSRILNYDARILHGTTTFSPKNSLYLSTIHAHKELKMGRISKKKNWPLILNDSFPLLLLRRFRNSRS